MNSYTKRRKRAIISDVFPKKENADLSKFEISIRPTKMKNLAQATWQEQKKIREELKANLPMLTSSDVRRFRIPHHEAVILELEEAGLCDSADYLKNLFTTDEKMRTIAGSHTVIAKKPRLKDQKVLIDRLRDGLTRAEQTKESGQTNSRLQALLETAVFFQSQTWEWWWIAEILYKSTLTAAESSDNVDEYMLTVIRYLYGRFLVNEMQQPQEALGLLSVARGASEKKAWNATQLVEQKQESVFKECNILLHKAFLAIARNIAEENRDLAKDACYQALNRAIDSEHREYVVKALYELGKSTLRCGDYEHALQHLYKLLAMAKRIADVEGICKAYMELAYTYKELGDHVNTEKYLRLFREGAAEFNLNHELAQSHYYTGEYFLSKGNPELASPYFEKALELYYDLELYEKADRTRSIAAISKGQEVIDQYIDLIVRCGEDDPQAVYKICQWKNSRLPFWTIKFDDFVSDKREESTTSDLKITA